LFTIQRLQKKDIDQVVSLENSAFVYPWKKEAIQKMSEDKNFCFLVAKINDEVVGNCALHSILGEGEITNVSVKKEVRMQGIAGEMFSELLKEGKKMRIQDYTLEVRSENIAAISLYKSFAFQKEGIRKNFYRNPIDDAWIMWRRDK
jgi:ribosomal-protein-alanine N-acetyltransferase